MEAIREKLITSRPSRENKCEGTFDPTAFIEGIRQLYNIREGWLAPFPWCEEFRLHLDSIFTTLKMVRRKKERGTKTDKIVSMSDIFRPQDECPQPRTVLLEGSPGMGKSTYCSKLAYDWATKKQEAEDCFPNFDVVLLLNCRDINSDLWDAIDDQLLPLDVQEQDKEEFFKFIRNNESNILLILDGLDELPTSKLPEFTEIIQGRMLPKCHLVVTARQEVGIKVRECCDSLLEIEGFTLQDARVFIHKYFKTSDLGRKLFEKLMLDNNLRGLTTNPLNTALLCLLFEDFQGILPGNRTHLYLEMVQCVLRRYRKKKGLPETNEDLLEVYKAQLKQLGSIALNGLLLNNMYFENSEFKNHASELPEVEFLSAQPGKSKRRPRMYYGFVHKSFQELFAGFYLCCQVNDNEIGVESLVDETRYFHELKQVLLFTCGMLALQCEEKAESLIKSLTTQVDKGDPHDFVTALECIKECTKEYNDLHVVLARVFGSFLQLDRVDFPAVSLSAEHIATLADVIKNNSTLTSLNLKCNNIGAAGSAALAEGIKTNSTLTELHLRCCRICAAGCAALAEGIKSNFTLTVLDLSYNTINDAGFAALAEVIKANSTLKVLNLSSNKVFADGGAALAEAINNNSTLTVLDFSRNGFFFTGGAALARGIKTISPLAVLDLSHCGIGVAGFQALGKAIKHNSTLKELNLSFNFVGYNSGGRGGAACGAALAEAIKNNSTLTKLDLTCNCIADAGCAELAEGIKTNSTLTELNLSDNCLSDACCNALVEAFEANASLKRVDLNKNDFSVSNKVDVLAKIEGICIDRCDPSTYEGNDCGYDDYLEAAYEPQSPYYYPEYDY